MSPVLGMGTEDKGGRKKDAVGQRPASLIHMMF